MLTTTSNGTRTSPVKRGVWVLKTLLGADPGLPVSSAGELPPRVPGIDQASVRQRLQSHRENPQCARCHAKIDPLGFALEGYDASGAYRTHETTGARGLPDERAPAIDATAQMPDGMTVNGVEGLTRALMKQAPQFRRALAGKLYSYALGRALVATDEGNVAAAAAHLEENGDTLRSLIHFVVASQAFRTK
jgi:hypothetical protein